MEMYFENDHLIFDGVLNESFPSKEFSQILGNYASKDLRISLKKVSRANSIGLSQFISCISTQKTSIKLINCPTWYTWQASQLYELNSEFIEVLSLFAPYVNTTTMERQEILLEISPDFINSDFYKNIEILKMPSGEELSADFDKEEFFFFLFPVTNNGVA